ncbi:hypothetical protein B9Z55_006238 [Caenorhabditis nigoni]|uniref:Uncharacterized protein n=2 Tax=Caenorhabditis nigoni TaxID=1611254 RepID=A0A2G5V4A1_9PELO|nr:hypothetical protein B9Z55_006238 [Caenorhabditis nigoni]
MPSNTQPNEIIRISTNYNSVMRRLTNKEIALEVEQERLQTAIMQNRVDVENYSRTNHILQYWSEQLLRCQMAKLVKINQDLREVRVLIERKEKIIERRTEIMQEQRGIFPLRSISNRAEFNKNKSG